jgi:molybdopterin synthase sulfur carrier subunit
MTDPIRIRYFASLRETLGRAEDQLPYEAGLSAGEVWRRVTADDEAGDPPLIALNHEYVSSDTPVNPGDELAFLPPITGG